MRGGKKGHSGREKKKFSFTAMAANRLNAWRPSNYQKIDLTPNTSHGEVIHGRVMHGRVMHGEVIQLTCEKHNGLVLERGCDT